MVQGGNGSEGRGKSKRTYLILFFILVLAAAGAAVAIVFCKNALNAPQSDDGMVLHGCPQMPDESGQHVTYTFNNGGDDSYSTVTFDQSGTSISSGDSDGTPLNPGVPAFEYGMLPDDRLGKNHGRIVGGIDAEIDDYPFFASLRARLTPKSFNNSHLCGASIINRKWVISAAHCTNKYGKATDWEVNVGVASRDDILNAAYTKKHTSIISAIVRRKDWDKVTYVADIMLLKLMYPIPAYTELIQPHCFPWTKEVTTTLQPDDGMTVVGLGHLSFGGVGTNTLQKVDLKMMSNSDCNTRFKNELVKTGMICAGIVEGGKDACQGDSGGPLSQKTDVNGTSEWVLRGLVSFGDGCGKAGMGAAYADVRFYAQWIAAAIAHYDSNYA